MYTLARNKRTLHGAVVVSNVRALNLVEDRDFSTTKQVGALGEANPAGLLVWKLEEPSPLAAPSLAGATLRQPQR